MIIRDNVFSIKDEDFGIKGGLFEHTSKTYRHSHDFIEIVYIEKGFTMHRVEGEQTSLLLPGDMIYILPDTFHEYWKSTGNEVLNCLFYPEVLGQDLDALTELPFLRNIFTDVSAAHWGKLHLHSGYRHSVSETIKKIYKESLVKQEGWKIRSKALLTDLLVNLSRAWKLTTARRPEEVSGTRQELIPTPSGIMQLLEASEKNKMSVEDMAAALGYSPEHFSRIFKKLTGISPSSYITSMRIAAAAEKLMDESLSVAEAAEFAGFEDVNYFSRIFRKETGLTPTQFRADNLY